MDEPREGNGRGDHNARYLDAGDLTQGLTGRSVRGGAATMVGQLATVAIGLAGTALLARVLSPRDFGLVAMVATLTALVELFKDLGLATATIQRASLDQQEASFLFWVNVALGAVVTAASGLLAPVLAWFYGEPELRQITLGLAASFLVGALGQQHGALLRRRMELGKLAVVRVASALLGTSVAAGAALSGFGYWSLVCMTLTGALCTSVGHWIACPWRPSLWRGRPSSATALLTFGGHLTGGRLLGFLARNLDNILIGRIWGGSALAFYAKAYQLLMLPVQQLIGPLTGVVVPALSRLQRDHGAFRRYYFGALSTLAMATMPAVVLLTVTADELVAILLGEQWARSANIFRLLAPAAFVGTFNGAAGWVWVALGQTNRQLMWGAYSLPVTIVAFVLGVVWGPEGVAIAFSVLQVTLRYFGLAYCYRPNDFLRMRDLGAALWRPAVASIAAGAIAAVARGVLPPAWSAVATLGVVGFGYSALYFATILILPGGGTALRGTLGLLRHLRERPTA